MEDAVAIYYEDCDGNVYVKCKVCEGICLNGGTAWEDHKIGKLHRKNLKPKPEKRSAKVIVPTGTAIIIEQTAIYYDAVQRYTLTLYKRRLLRSKF